MHGRNVCEALHKEQLFSLKEEVQTHRKKNDENGKIKQIDGKKTNKERKPILSL